MITSATRKVLQESPLFAELSEKELEKIIALSREETFEAGDVLFNEGDVPQTAYIIEQGKVAVDMGLHLGREARRRATIETVSRGQPVGWSALVGAAMFTATAWCVEKTVAVAIDGEGLRHLFEEDSYLGYRVLRKLVDLVRSRLVSVRDTLAHILSIASHDLKAPLHAVQSYNQVLLDGYAGEMGDKQRSMLLRSGERIAGLLRLIDDILDLSRLGAGELEKETVSLLNIAETSMENVRSQATEKGLKLEGDWPRDLPQVRAQPARLQQVITNLLSNAVRFTPEGGEIRLRIRDAGDEIAVEVMDTGQGISEDELPKIFDDFYRGKSAEAGGVGLGLSIAKRIIEAHGGRIWAESPYPESEKGTKFTFTLAKD